MASSSRGGHLRSSGCWLLLVHGLLALTALDMHGQRGAGVEALPITSRPIEGNAQKDAWEAWLRLPYEQKSLEKQKKVMPKSIFALPFRHCPPGHKLYNERCIPQINIDPTDLVEQELQGALGVGDASNGSPTGFTDYDYSDSESDELVYEVPLGPFAQNDQLSTLPTASGAEDQALPSEDAPLKFNIFEKKFPTAPDAPYQPDVVNATTATLAISTTIAGISAATATATAMATATTTATPTIATMREDALKAQRQPNNRIAGGSQDLQADASDALPSTTSLSIPSSSSSAFSDIGNIDAIVVPAGVPLDAKPTVHLVTSSMSDEREANADAKPNTDAAVSAGAEAEAAETDLAQLLKADAFLPAYGSSVDLMPTFSHRRVAPLLSADLDGEDSATDIVPTAAESDAATTTATEALATPTTTAATTATATATITTTLSSTQPRVPAEEQDLDERVLKKSKVQPVRVSPTIATTATTVATTAATTATTIALTSTTTQASSTTTTTTAAAATVAAAKSEVAAIHQDANGNTRDDDRFYYQHFARNDAASTSSTSTSTTSSSSSNADGDLDVLNDMASSDNLMTNTIGGQGESEKAASEINFEQELRIINELVKDKRRLSQLRQQQQEQQPTSSTAIPSTTTTTTTTPATIIESSSDSSSTSATSTSKSAAAAAAETTTFWSKLMPMLDLSSTEATTEPTTETVTMTTATPTDTTAESSIATSATPTATAATVATTRSTQHLSINANRSNRNSKIIRVDSIGVSPQPITTSTTTTTTTTAKPATSPTPEDENYTPFWWLPNIGWRLDRQIDEKGEDRSLLLRFFRTFRANESDLAATTSTTFPSRR